jgi:hypothetical protein
VLARDHREVSPDVHALEMGLFCRSRGDLIMIV